MTAEYALPPQVPLQFVRFIYQGQDAGKFLQGQVTVNVDKLADISHYQATAICDLKGRIHFGLWMKAIDDQTFELVLSEDLSQAFAAHIRKYGAFSKAALSDPETVYPRWADGATDFVARETDRLSNWQQQAILHGDAWITAATAHIFQPQELRLHQRGGVDYDKGCYLGQEIIARLWFKAKPKHWLHLIEGQADAPRPADLLNDDVQVVNSVTTEHGHWLALVSAKPEALVALNVTRLDLPEHLNGAVGREV